MALAGVGWALVLVPGYPLVANQGGRDRVGFFTGLYYLFGSGAAIVAPGTAGAVMDALGNRALFGAAAAALVVGAVVLALAGRQGVAAGRGATARP
jgi:MFS family permease